MGSRIGVADRWWTRLRGYLGRPPPGRGEGLLFVPSRGVHMYGMKVSLDVVLMDDSGQVVATYPELAPGNRTEVHPEARYALELPAGTIQRTGTQVGDLLEWGEDLGSNGADGGDSDHRDRILVVADGAPRRRPGGPGGSRGGEAEEG